MTKYLIGLDRGHSGVRAVCYDLNGNLIGSSNIEVPIHFPEPGQSVCYADELEEKILTAIRKVVESLPEAADASDIAGISFSIAGGPLIGYAADGSLPLDIIFPGDVRRSDFFYASKALEDAGITTEEYTEAVTTPIPWIISNIMFLKEQYPEKCRQVRHWAVSEHALFLRALGSDKMWETECRGGMNFNYNPIRREYVDRICDAVGLHGEDFLPLHYAGECCGAVSEKAAAATGLKAGTPLYLGTNDMIPHVLAQGAVNPSEAIANYGTFGSTGMRIDNADTFRPMPDSEYSLHATGGGFTDDWQISSSVNGCGASYAWLNKNVCAGLFGDKAGTPELYLAMNQCADTSSVGANGLYYYPDVIDDNAAFLGIGTHTDMADMVRAVLEGMAFEMLGALKEVEISTGIPIKKLFVAGGITKADVFLHILADMYDMDIARADVDPDMAGAKGAAMIAGIGAGIFKDIFDAVNKMVGDTLTVVHPDPVNVEKYKALFETWNNYRRKLKS